jgi:hypothetical protein
VEASSGISARTDLGGTIIAEGSTRAGLYILTAGTAAGSYGSIWWGNGNTNTDAYITVGNDTRAMDFGTADGFAMRITSSRNVLIGTTTDSGYKLRVVGGSTNLALGADGTVLDVSGASGKACFMGFDGGGMYQEIVGSSGATRKLRLQVYNGVNDYAQFFIDGANNYIYPSTNVNFGIGSTAPTVKLRVQSSGSSFTSPDNNNVAAVSIYNSNNSSTNAHAVLSLRTQISGGNPFISFDVENETGWSLGMENSTNQFRLAQGWNSLTSTPVISVPTNGNVLIGTTTDIGTKLNVNGTSYISGAASFGSTIDVNGNVTLTQDTNDLIFQQTNSSSHGIVWKNTSYAKDSASIRPTGNGAWATQGIGFYTGNAGDSTTAPSLRFNIQAGGDSIFYNNVGIGTTGPAYRLDVNGTTRVQGDLITTGRQYVQSTPVNIKLPWSSLIINGTAVSDTQASDGLAGVRYSSSGSTTFFYGPYQAIDAGSYVARFRIKVASNASASYIGYIDVVGTNISGEAVSLRPNMLPTGGDYYYIDVPFNCNNDSSVFETRWIGWVGGITDTYIDHVLIVPQSRTNNVYVTDGDDYTIYESQLPRLTIKNATGNVGIGTTSPTNKLHVNGGSIFNQNGFLYMSNQFPIVWGAAVSIEGDNAAGTLTLKTESSHRIFINNVGNVGVGTTAPAYKLDVSGTIRATGDVIAYSDARVKENVETIDGALDKVMKMRGVSYNKIGEHEKKVGVIAQEILKVLPEVVSQDETGTYSVAYGNITAVLIEAVKELASRVELLEEKLKQQ